MYPVILALDFGLARIGVAISRGTLAEPLEVLPPGKVFFQRLIEIVDRERVEKIVIGISENEMAEKTRVFLEEVRVATRLPIELVDETLSSHTVHQKLRDLPKKKRGQSIDHFAAAEFLQEYLDEQVDAQ